RVQHFVPPRAVSGSHWVWRCAGPVSPQRARPKAGRRARKTPILANQFGSHSSAEDSLAQWREGYEYLNKPARLQLCFPDRRSRWPPRVSVAQAATNQLPEPRGRPTLVRGLRLSLTSGSPHLRTQSAEARSPHPSATESQVELRRLSAASLAQVGNVARPF